ncbi:hypothetical protein D3C81_1595470 [compost metagenome]
MVCCETVIIIAMPCNSQAARNTASMAIAARFIRAKPPAERRSASRMVAITTEGSGCTAIIAIQNPPAPASITRF